MTLLFIVGFLANGPYALITTAVSADLGTHPKLKGSTRALATVNKLVFAIEFSVISCSFLCVFDKTSRLQRLSMAQAR